MWQQTPPWERAQNQAVLGGNATRWGGPGNAHSCPQALHQRWGIHWHGVTQLPGLRCVTQTPEDPFPCVPTKKQAAD